MSNNVDLVMDPRFYLALHRIDRELAEETRAKGCPFCGGPLHYATYRRAPRGGPEDLPEAMMRRLGLCCGREGCRRRVLPPSCLFLDEPATREPRGWNAFSPRGSGGLLLLLESL